MLSAVQIQSQVYKGTFMEVMHMFNFSVLVLQLIY